MLLRGAKQKGIILPNQFPNRFFVFDEALQLTPQEAKTVVTRMSRGSKLVMLGDPAQIDHPYVRQSKQRAGLYS